MFRRYERYQNQRSIYNFARNNKRRRNKNWFCSVLSVDALPIEMIEKKVREERQNQGQNKREHQKEGQSKGRTEQQRGEQQREEQQRGEKQQRDEQQREEQQREEQQREEQQREERQREEQQREEQQREEQQREEQQREERQFEERQREERQRQRDEQQREERERQREEHQRKEQVRTVEWKEERESQENLILQLRKHNILQQYKYESLEKAYQQTEASLKNLLQSSSFNHSKNFIERFMEEIETMSVGGHRSRYVVFEVDGVALSSVQSYLLFVQFEELTKKGKDRIFRYHFQSTVREKDTPVVAAPQEFFVASFGPSPPLSSGERGVVLCDGVQWKEHLVQKEPPSEYNQKEESLEEESCTRTHVRFSFSRLTNEEKRKKNDQNYPNLRCFWSSYVAFTMTGEKVFWGDLEVQFEKLEATCQAFKEVQCYLSHLYLQSQRKENQTKEFRSKKMQARVPIVKSINMCVNKRLFANFCELLKGNAYRPVDARQLRVSFFVDVNQGKTSEQIARQGVRLECLNQISAEFQEKFGLGFYQVLNPFLCTELCVELPKEKNKEGYMESHHHHHHHHSPRLLMSLTYVGLPVVVAAQEMGGGRDTFKTEYVNSKSVYLLDGIKEAETIDIHFEKEQKTSNVMCTSETWRVLPLCVIELQ